MYDYKIGIIDEDVADIEYIERTILINKPESITDEQVEFWRYPLPTETENVYDSVVKNVVSKIMSGEIHALIVDYQIIISATFLEGTEIFNKLSKIVLIKSVLLKGISLPSLRTPLISNSATA